MSSDETKEAQKLVFIVCIVWMITAGALSGVMTNNNRLEDSERQLTDSITTLLTIIDSTQ